MKWQVEKVVGKYRCYARTIRSAIVVRLEKDGNTSRYAEWALPKILGFDASIAQAVLQTTDEHFMDT